MRQPDIKLTDEDPTVFGKCPKCDKRGKGVNFKDHFYFGKAFTARRWKRGPICDNCETPLVEVRRIAVTA